MIANKAFEGRVGRFRVPLFTYDKPERLLPLFAQVVVLHMDYTRLFGVVEYTAWSPHFMPVPEGSAIPVYDPILNEEGAVIEWSFS